MIGHSHTAELDSAANSIDKHYNKTSLYVFKRTVSLLTARRFDSK
jgi:hypothetical protein